jgi:hypothetical protein
LPSAPTPDSSVAPRDEVRRLEHQIAELREMLAAVLRDQQVQFTRIAQIQADIDLIRAAWSKLKEPDPIDPTYTGLERRRTQRKVR